MNWQIYGLDGLIDYVLHLSNDVFPTWEDAKKQLVKNDKETFYRYQQTQQLIWSTTVANLNESKFKYYKR